MIFVAWVLGLLPGVLLGLTLGCEPEGWHRGFVAGTGRIELRLRVPKWAVENGNGR